MNEIRNLILDKAKERAMRYGYKKTTMDELSKDCKISKKTIYEHFADKEDLFKNLILRECEQTTGLLTLLIQDIENPLDRLVRLIQISIPYLNQDHFLAKTLKDEDLFLAFVNRKYHDLIDEHIMSIIIKIIQEGKEKGIFRDVDPQIVAYGGLKLFQAFSYGKTGFMVDHPNEEECTKALIDFIIHGLVKR